MRLRLKLALAFLVVALLPAALILTFGLRTMRRALQEELDRRLEASVRTAETFDAEQRRELVRRLEDVARSAAAAELVESLELGDAPAMRSAGERLMQAGRLQLFSVLDAQGRTLTSGHWPARIHEPEPVLFESTRHPAEARWQRVELPTAEGPRSTLALVAAVPIPVERETPARWAVGGLVVQPHWAPTLAALTGAQVELRHGQSVLTHAGQAEPPLLQRRVPEQGPVQWALSFSGAPLLHASRELTQAALALALLGLTGAFWLAWLMSRRITRPVEALTVAARQLAAGDLTARVRQPASGEIATLVATFNQMGHDLQSTTRRLVASERTAAWQEVARGLAHELKNPLTPIRMSLETLLAAQEHPSFRTLFAQSAPVMLEEVDRLRRTIDEFSRFARLPSPTLSPLDLASWAEQVLVLHGTLPPSIQLVQSLAPGVVVQADRDQLTQLLLNLLRNAEEAMADVGADPRQGPRQQTLRVRVAKEGAHALLEVADTGPGIPAHLRAQVLEPHFSTKDRGSGLGLAIAARICQEHGGTLELADAPEGGALVRVMLPLSRPDAAPEGKRPR